MTDHELAQVITLANTLDRDYGPRVTACANMLRQYLQSRSDVSAEERNGAVRTASRIYDVMPNIDEPRFSLHDYMDAVANAHQEVDLDKLYAGLDDEAFAAAMIWLAAYKRETYEGLAHVQEPLEIDIWREP